MDYYNKIALLLSYGLTREEIIERVDITRPRVNSIIKEIRDRFFKDEKNGYILIISEDGTPKKVELKV